MDIREERQELFDEDFNHKSQNVERVKNFCKVLSDTTGVQVCNNNGMTYEYLPQVYNSVEKLKESEK